ncbi:DUF2063 domain-containing protein [Haematospirillum sp. H1815]|uniref:HvfC/BufC family peptide modification chaperone n=1 Tax=Haematospirillum sp. H1815 TaxID=2723108 RepID=UPI00143C300F|nr:DNA-binding domain-containing protein [Haematospirillum sp. H1815]NKD76220.1 DUF2063 domain-containing protein [Haematospirillum sp. H1815]
MPVFPDRLAPSWADLQSYFAKVLLGQNDTLHHLDEWLEGPGLSVHRNTILFGQLDAMAAVFPAVRRLVGADCFQGLVRAFFRAHPVHVPCLVDAGEGFPAFLGGQESLSAMPWLVDVAALEWECHRVSRHAESPNLDPASLSGLNPAFIDDLVFVPRAASCLFSSLWPVNTIRLANMVPCADQDVATVSLGDGPEFLLLVRPGSKVLVEHIGQPGSVFLQRCFSGERFGQAASGTLALHPDFDLQAFLIRALGGQWFAGVRSSGE